VTPSGDASGRAGDTLRLVLLFAVHAVGTANIMGVMAFAPRIQAELGMSTATFGLLVAAYYATQPVIALPAGWLADRIGVRRALALAMATIAIAAALFSAVGNAVSAGLVLALAGVGYGLVNPATATGVVTWFTPQWRATMMSVKQAGVPAGGIIAAGLVALAGDGGWRMVALAVALASTATAVAALLVPVPSRAAQAFPAGTPAPRSGIATLLRNRSLLRICWATGLLVAGQAAFFAFLVLFLVGPIGLSPAAAAAVFGAAHATSAVARIGWGLVADRLWPGRPKACLRVIAATAALGFVLLGASAWLGVAAAVVAALLLGATVGGFAGVSQSAAVGAAPRHQAGAAMGLFLVFTPLGSILGPPTFGALVTLGGGYVLPNLMLAMLAVLAVLLIAGRHGVEDRP
jgi:predicted MFS family arabinose efflux permease